MCVYVYIYIGALSTFINEMGFKLKQVECSLMWLNWKKVIFVFTYLKVVIIVK